MAGEVEQIKNKIDIVDFLKEYIDLRPAGKNLKALCPFHSEKTPSFVVSPERKMWRCFGSCGEGGDVFKFLMKHESLEFHEALKVLAERAGIPLQRLNPLQQKEFGVLYDINEAAKDFFKEELKKNEVVLKYLNERGLSDETIQEFDLGFARGGETLVLALLKEGYDIADIVRAGLAQKNVYNLYRDKFNNRVVFPIFNSLGKAVAFTGRILPGYERDDTPKYLNSPETPVFSKSKILYGFHRSKSEIAKSRMVFVVEGQMDFLMAWQSGVRQAVAVSGTGLTNHHLERLRRVADTAVMSFDNDDAGLKAMERGLEIFSDFDFHVRVIDLGDHKDPADACKADPKLLLRAIDEAGPAFQRLFEINFKKTKEGDFLGRKRLTHHFLEMIKKLQSAIEQQTWMRELARFSGVGEVFLWREFESLPTKQVTTIQEQVVPKFRSIVPEKAERIDLIIRRLLAIAFLDQSYLERLVGVREMIPVSYHQILEGAGGDAALDYGMRASYEFDDTDKKSLEGEFSELLRYLHIENLKRKQADLSRVVREAQVKGDDDVFNKAMHEFYAIAKQLESIKK